ncbi:MAG: hypothetical protein J6W29_01090 [Neisseriaceae bacterium]|nr:hypothetical protein [Neisseriaceae bacterium]
MYFYVFRQPENNSVIASRNEVTAWQSPDCLYKLNLSGSLKVKPVSLRDND